MNKKGFTLPELLAVITILAIIIGIAMLSVLGIMKNAADKVLKENEDNFKDAAIAYCIDNRSDCTNITYQKLVDGNYYSDDSKGYCKDLKATVVVTKKNNNTNDLGTSNYDYEVTLTGNCKN